jgi:diketogulonate reductase-like aldo/keto reductase
MESVGAGGATIPKLGPGTWQTTGETCTETVRQALEMGYRHVDTAQVYGNEAAVGAGIAAADVNRSDVFLTTKVWRSNLRGDEVAGSVRESLDRLGVASVDLLLVHWPHPRVPVAETLGAMAELREAGLVDHLGVSNFTRSQLRAATNAVDAPVVADQVLYHPYKDQSSLREYCLDSGVALTAYSPLARGRSSTTRFWNASAGGTTSPPRRLRSAGWSSRTASSPSPKPPGTTSGATASFSPCSGR